MKNTISLVSVLFSVSLLGVHGGVFPELELVEDGFLNPVFLTHSGDGSNRLFVVEQGGRIRIIKNSETLPLPFLDISHRVTSGGEQGLLGLAFHPQFPSNGRLFVNYTKTVDGQLRTVVAEYGVSAGNPNQAAFEERVILEFVQPQANHNAGMLAFGPDGLLYIATGDGGGGGDPQNNGQNLASLLGKILRIDVDGEQPYAIPSSNPFVGQSGTRGEIFAYGFRNPWRFSFDRTTGRLFVGDVGQNAWEEIDLVRKGGNYGWRVMEGTHCFNPPSGCNREGLELPIAEYSRTDGRSVTGGYVYRGAEAREYWGTYLFGDYPTGRIWSLTEEPGGGWVRRLQLETGLNIASFGEDETGGLFVVDLGGAVYRLRFSWRAYFAHAGDGVTPLGVFQSTVVLVNETPEPLNATLRFYDSGGSLRAERQLQVPGGRSAAVSSSGLPNPVYAGWVGAVADRAFAGTLIFGLSDIVGRPVREAGVAASEMGRLFRAHVSRHVLRGIDTGLAVANPSPVPVTITISVKGEAGVIAETLVELDPGQHQAHFIGDLEGIPNQFEGTVDIAGTGEFIVTLLRTQDGIHSASLPVGLR